MKHRSATLSAIAFASATIGGIMIPVVGSLLAVVLGSIAKKRALSGGTPHAISLASLSVLFGWGGLACWVFLLAAFFLTTRH